MAGEGCQRLEVQMMVFLRRNDSFCLAQSWRHGQYRFLVPSRLKMVCYMQPVTDVGIVERMKSRYPDLTWALVPSIDK